ncbi:MAG: endonuclease [Planctomycetota bacterium]|nr:MAG: endonuclease [Planctomycetota bacterium]
MSRGGGALLRLLSWNIHKAIGGVDRRCSLERVAAVVQHYRPDVLALQEVDDGVPRSRHARQHQELADQLGYAHVHFGATVQLKTGCYGNAILSHHPIVRREQIDLTFPLKKVRAALYAELVVPVGVHHLSLHLFNWHLGLAGVERRWQVKRLLQSARLSALNTRSRVIIAGDTNDWTGALPRGQLSREGFSCATGSGRSALRTFPAFQPVGALDRVFLRGPLELAHLLHPRLDLAATASDHRPVVLDLKLKRRA